MVRDCVPGAVSNRLHLPASSELGHDVGDEILDLELML